MVESTDRGISFHCNQSNKLLDELRPTLDRRTIYVYCDGTFNLMSTEGSAQPDGTHCTDSFVTAYHKFTFQSEFLALKLESMILGHSSNPVCGFSMLELVRLSAFWPMENWLDSSFNQIQGWSTVQESYSRALGPHI